MTTRRQYLRLAGAGVLGTAGCLGNGGGDGLDPEGPDGYPPPFEVTPEEQSVDPSTFATTTQDGVDVPLAPIEATYYWYRRREARFADARGESQYRRSRVYGSVWSPASGDRSDDPVTDWPESDRIVCYCGCPHHLSSIRAAKLISAGYEDVYVIDEGFWEWHERGFPMAGTEIESEPAEHVIRGRTDPRDAGRSAWVTHEPTGQVEATEIDPDGGYRLALRFSDVTRSSRLVVETPSYRREGSLAALTAGMVTGDSAPG